MIFNTLIKLRSILEKKEYNKMFIFFVMSFFAMILEILSVGLIIPFLNTLINSGNNLGNLKFLSLFGNLNINYIIIILVGVYSFKTIFLTIISFFQSKYLGSVRAALANKLFKLYINRSYDFHLKNNTSKLIRNIGEANLIILIITAMITFINEFIVVLGVSIFVIFFQPKISIFVVTFLGIIGYLFIKIVKNKNKLWGKIRHETIAQLLKTQNESFRLIKEIKILDRAKHIIDRFIFNNNKIVKSELNHTFISSLPRLWLEWLVIITFLLSVSFMLFEGRNLSEIVVIIGVFAAAAFRVMPSLTRIMNSAQQISYHQPVLENISKEIVNLDKNIEKNIEIKTFNSSEKLDTVEIEDLAFHYDNKKTILKSINIKFEKGYIYGICGPSGSGKSTLINLILGFLKPNNGKIKFNNKIIFENLREWRNNIGFVPQEIFLCDGTIKDNILLQLPEDKVDNVNLENSVRNANLDEFVKSLDNGLNTNIGEFGDKISGGQKQRIGIARSILNKPKVLILDEFTSSLDNSTEEKILNEISLLKKDKIIIIISHKLSTLSLCDKIFKLEKQTLFQTK
jgi:ATP-binding cassette, subfamily B, bacterial PglK